MTLIQLVLERALDCQQLLVQPPQQLWWRTGRQAACCSQERANPSPHLRLLPYLLQALLPLLLLVLLRLILLLLLLHWCHGIPCCRKCSGQRYGAGGCRVKQRSEACRTLRVVSRCCQRGCHNVQWHALDLYGASQSVSRSAGYRA